MKHVMVDCESFGLRPTSAITTIGAVEFYPLTPALGAQFHESIDLQSSMNHGLTVDADAILWWMGQAPAAQQAMVTKLKAASSLSTVLGAFTNFLARVGDRYEIKLWSCGSRDFEWLESAYTAIRQKVPWGYRVGDYRTIRDEFGTKADEPPATTSHDALCDAVWQAQYLQNVFARLRRRDEDAVELTKIKVQAIRAFTGGINGK